MSMPIRWSGSNDPSPQQQQQPEQPTTPQVYPTFGIEQHSKPPLRPLQPQPYLQPESFNSSSSSSVPTANYPYTQYYRAPQQATQPAPGEWREDRADAKRIRISRACDGCRRKKIKCDTTGPGDSCKNCQLAQVECTFNDSAKKRGPPKGYIEVLENRLKRMERILGGLADEETSDEREKDMTNQSEKGNATPVQHGLGAEIEVKQEDVNTSWNHDPSGLSSLHSTGITRYVGDMSPLPLLAQKINFEDARVASTIGFKVRKFGQSLLLYKEEDQERAQGASERMLRAVGKLKPGQTINGMNDWIYAVAGIDRVTSDRLMRIYFLYIHPGLPVINKILFLKQYRRELGDYPAPTLLCSMYGAAVRYINNCRLFGDKVLPEETGDWDLREGWSESLFEHLLVYVKGRYAPCVATIQALVISQFHRASLDERMASGWLLNSAATRMAQDLGLHRSSEGWDIPESEKETRRRLWWSVYIMDKWSAAATGRPQTIFDEDCDEIYPNESSTWEEVMDQPPKDSTSTEPRFPSLDPSVAQKVKVDKIPLYQPFVQLVKLSELLGRILQGLYTPRAKRHSAQHGSDAIVSYLDNALSEWRANLPPSLQISTTNVSRLDSRGHSPLLSMSGLIYLTYCTLLVLLHRPFIEKERQGHDTRLSLSSLTICTNAATRCVDIAEKMHYRDFMLISWSFSIYPVFTASLIHIYNAASTDHIVADVAKSNIVKAMSVIKRLSKLTPGAGKLFGILKQLMETRKISVGEHVLSDMTDDDQPIANNKGKRKRRQRRASHSPTQSKAGFKIGMSPRTSDVGRGSSSAGSVSPLPAHPTTSNSTTTLHTNSNISRDPPDRPSSAGSTPSSIINGDWISGLCSTMEHDNTLQPLPSQKDNNDMHSLRQFGLPMESMFPSVDQIQAMPTAATTTAPDIQQQQQNNLAGSMMLPFHSTDSFLFGIPDFGFTTAQQNQPMSQPMVPYSSSSGSMYTATTRTPSSADQQQQNQFRNRPDNPFWSMPSSLELDDWTAYLLPQQQQHDSIQSIGSSASQHASSDSQPWNPSNGWM
ncbi:fungal-specific transcription factor domain-containing protein [Fennellomyces sp. T-0311]|nr:fungal-specific transcription factor domain-containing protein [Fennellomyces sp. T-0311]